MHPRAAALIERLQLLPHPEGGFYCWQAARSLGPYALAGCTVGPGFEFTDFSFLRDAEDLLARLRAIDADLAALA